MMSWFCDGVVDVLEIKQEVEQGRIQIEKEDNILLLIKIFVFQLRSFIDEGGWLVLFCLGFIGFQVQRMDQKIYIVSYKED